MEKDRADNDAYLLMMSQKEQDQEDDQAIMDIFHGEDHERTSITLTACKKCTELNAQVKVSAEHLAHQRRMYSDKEAILLDRIQMQSI